MSDEQQYGEFSHGFPSERMHEPPPKEEPLTEGDSRQDILQVANALSEKWKAEGRSADSEKPIIDRRYINHTTGEDIPQDKILSVEEVGRDLSAVHKVEAEQKQLQTDAELASAVDSARSDWHYQNNAEYRAQVDSALAQQQQPEKQQSQPQAQEPAQQPVDELTAAWQKADPALRAAIEAEVGRVHAAQKQFADAAHEAARVSASAIFAQHPDLAGLSSDQINVALGVLSRENPEKFMQIQSQIAQAKHYYDQSQQYRAAEQQQAQQKATREFNRYVTEQDAIFERTVAEEYGAEKVKAVKGAVWDIAQEAYGLSKEQLQGLWNTQPLLRTAAMQKMFFDAAAFQMAKKGIAQPDKPPVPPSQRPGVSGQVRSGEDGNIAALERRVSKTGSLKDATQLRLAKLRAREG